MQTQRVYHYCTRDFEFKPPLEFKLQSSHAVFSLHQYSIVQLKRLTLAGALESFALVISY